MDRRIIEAERLGFKTIFTTELRQNDLPKGAKIQIVQIADIAQLPSKLK